jgi:hypothetical protein
MPFRVSELRKNECDEIFTLFEHEESGTMRTDELVYAVRYWFLKFDNLINTDFYDPNTQFKIPKSKKDLEVLID